MNKKYILPIIGILILVFSCIFITSCAAECGHCDGTGKCYYCNGTGWNSLYNHGCDYCWGSGKCKYCDGTGKVK